MATLVHAMAAMSWASCQISKIAGAHAPGMPGTFSPQLRVSDCDMHHGTCVSFVFGGGGKLFRHSRRMRNPQFYVSGKRPMAAVAPFVARAPLYQHVLTLITAWISNNLSDLMWDWLLIYSQTSTTGPIWEWISNFIPHMDVIIYPSWHYS